MSGQGYPIRVCELLQSLRGLYYAARTSVHDAKNVLKTKKAIQKGIENQMAKKGFSFIEVLSPCPVNWGMTPQQAVLHVEKEMAAYYPLGEFKVDGKIV